MRIIVIILALLLLSSCYTKKQSIRKFCKSDSVSVTIHDTIITETILSDTVFSASIDTLILTKDRLSIKYIKVRDSIYLSGECKGDTVIITKEVKVQTICPSIGSYSFNQWLEAQPFWVNLIVMCILILALLYLFRMVGEWANKKASK
jgi:hypothetical protein